MYLLGIDFNLDINDGTVELDLVVTTEEDALVLIES